MFKKLKISLKYYMIDKCRNPEKKVGPFFFKQDIILHNIIWMQLSFKFLSCVKVCVTLSVDAWSVYSMSTEGQLARQG